mgnify:CR=1 FL=1
MDTTTQIPANFIDNIESLQIAKLSDDELSTIDNFIYLTRDAQETKQLFDIFYFNLLCLRNNFVLYAGDTVKKSPNCPEYSSENIAVNALVINLISSAKTLAESLRTVAIRWFKKDEENRDSFNIYVSDVYDKSIVYRMLMNLRDFAQHGNLPVSQKEGRYSFDIFQILATPHFNLNKQVEADMNEFLSNFDQSEVTACLALTITIADFTVKVIDIYRQFLTYMKENISSAYNKIQQMIKINPTIVCNTHEILNGYIIYFIGNECHAFNPTDNPNKMIYEYDKYTADIYEDEVKALKALKRGFKNCSKPKKEKAI